MIKSGDSISFHHFGLAVKDFAKAEKFYKNLGYNCSEPIIDPLQNVELVLCTADNLTTVELVKPVDNKSPIVNYLNKNNEGIYHTCYEVDDIEKDVNELFSDNKAICVSEPKPGVLFNNRMAAFYYVKDVGLIEFLQR